MQCLIRNLVEEERVIEDKEELKKYITDYYKKLFGSEPDPKVALNDDF